MRHSAWKHRVGAGIIAIGFATAVAKARTLWQAVPLTDPAILLWGPLLVVTALAIGLLILLVWRQRAAPAKTVQRAGATELNGALVISAARR